MREALLVLLLCCHAGCFEINLTFNCSRNVECSPGICLDHRCNFDSDGDGPLVMHDLAGVDLAGVDLSQRDLASSDLAGVDLAAVPACALPQLLVTVEYLASPAKAGQVRRFHIPPSGPLESCPPLEGSGALGQYPEAVAQLGSQIAVAARDGVFVIDPALDLVTASWSNDPQTAFPIDVAPLSTGEGLEVAVAWAMPGTAPLSMFQLDLFLPSMVSGAKHSWFANGDLHLSNVIGMTIDAFDPTKLLVLDDKLSATPQAEAYLDPFVPSETSRLDEPNNLGLRSISSIAVGGAARTVWAATNAYDGYYMLYEPSPSPAPSSVTFGPVVCGSCQTLHAVPDPVNASSAFILCDGATTGSRAVYRAQRVVSQIQGSCVQVLDGTTLRADDRLTHLGIAMP